MGEMSAMVIEKVNICEASPLAPRMLSMWIRMGMRMVLSSWAVIDLTSRLVWYLVSVKSFSKAVISAITTVSVHLYTRARS